MKMPEITNSPKVMITGASDVIDLVGDDANPLAVVSAFVKGPNGLIDTPIKSPDVPRPPAWLLHGIVSWCSLRSPRKVCAI